MKKLLKDIWHWIKWPFRKIHNWLKGQFTMESAKMNYYFTGLLIVMLTALALCGGPHVQ